MFDPKKIARRHKFNKFKGVGKQVNNDINAKKVHQKYLGGKSTTIALSSRRCRTARTILGT